MLGKLSRFLRRYLIRKFTLENVYCGTHLRGAYCKERYKEEIASHLSVSNEVKNLGVCFKKAIKNSFGGSNISTKLGVLEQEEKFVQSKKINKAVYFDGFVVLQCRDFNFKGLSPSLWTNSVQVH